MMDEFLPSRDLVLIGAGHTNLHAVRMWRMRPIPDVRLTLISPFSRSTYSGMLPGTLAGLYQPDDMEIDLYRFSESCGVRLIVDEATGFDPASRQVLFAERPPVRYDVASIGIGSVPGQRELWSGKAGVLSIKPMATFVARFEARLAKVLGGTERHVGRQADPPQPPLTKGGRETVPTGSVEPSDLPNSVDPKRGCVRIVVVGAGAGGTEVAFGVDARVRARGIEPQISLVDANEEILAGYSPRTVSLARRELARRGISVFVGRRVSEIRGVESAELMFDGGATLSADIVIWATAAATPPVLAGFRLPKTDDGFLAVRPTLQTTADFPVFAVGDTASIVGRRIPKAGVYAVREGPILWANLERTFENRELIEFEPQRGFLSMLSTGDARAIAEYKGLSGHGRWAWVWKDYIDRKFMRMHQDYSPRDQMRWRAGGVSPRMSVQDNHSIAPPMRCTGCGGKIGSQVLTAALSRLPTSGDGRTTLGLATPDDAAVIDRHAAPVDVLSVDFFPAFLNDPYVVGRVAALNALSDLWAMGSQPLGAMAIVTLPEGAARQQTELLYQLLAGGFRELTNAGATLWGGHTTQGPELTIGYAVAGQLAGEVPFTKGGLRAGDRLILTKPLGTATLLAAHQVSLCRAEWMDELIEQLLQSNAAASRLAREFNVTAATDVTGFGLAGHLFEMLEASRVSARLSLGSLPVLNGFAELNAAGVRSSLDPANRTVESRCRLADAALTARPEYHALFDPQTSGGLLIGVPESQARAFVSQLKEGRVARAVDVGEVVEASEAPVLELIA